jgi:hypothetical protein
MQIIMGALEHALDSSNRSFILLLLLLRLATTRYIDAASPLADEITNGRGENDKGNNNNGSNVADE